MAGSDAAPARVLRIAELLFTRIITGFSNKEIADALSVSPSSVSRDLELLRQAGWAQKLDSGRWALTEKPSALMHAYQRSMTELAARKDSFEARVTLKTQRFLEEHYG